MKITTLPPPPEPDAFEVIMTEGEMGALNHLLRKMGLNDVQRVLGDQSRDPSANSVQSWKAVTAFCNAVAADKALNDVK